MERYKFNGEGKDPLNLLGTDFTNKMYSPQKLKRLPAILDHNASDSIRTITLVKNTLVNSIS